jgi:hypothetical protein
MSNTYFLRTVRALDESLSIDDRLTGAVHNSGNLFFEGAVSRHLEGAVEVWEMGDVPHGASTLVLSMSNFISPATDLGEFADEIERSGVERIVMIGAGAQAESYEREVTMTPGTKRFLSLLSERSTSIGVRGYYTAEVLAKIGIHNVDVIGCPSLFYHGARDFKVVKPAINGRRLRAVAHVTPYGNLRDGCSHLLSFAVRECEAYIAQSESFLTFSPGTEARWSYFLQYFNDGDFSHAEVEAWMRRRVRFFFDIERWISYMAEIDFAVGGRFHGNMAAILAGTPALNLVQDSRTRELCEYLNLPYRFLQDFNGRESVDSLYDQTDFSFFNATFPLKYDIYRHFLEKNGLRTRLAEGEFDMSGVSGKVRLEACLDLLRSAHAVGFDEEKLARELMNRIKVDRSWAMMKLAESGKHDLRLEGS